MKITVAYLLYNAHEFVPELVKALMRQRHPSMPDPAQWMQAIFLDDASRDGTVEVLRRELTAVGNPSFVRVVAQERNIGLAASVNLAFSLATTPYILTCHCDVIFGTDLYVSKMLELLEQHPEAAVITGQPAVPTAGRLPFAEKLNLVGNLMDIFPARGAGELVPVGFAEGRCDVFRKAAIESVGGYDRSYRTAGEDQVLAARLRRSGWKVYQAPALPYYLGASSEQDTIRKLVRHMALFGRIHPLLLLEGGTAEGFVGETAGSNRRARFLLRFNHLASVLALIVAALLLAGGAPGSAACIIAAMLAWKAALFSRHFRALAFRPGEVARFLLVVPLLDFGYVWGLPVGMALAARKVFSGRLRA